MADAALQAAMERMIGRCRAAAGQAATDDTHAELPESAAMLLFSGLPCPPAEVLDLIDARVAMAIDRLMGGDPLPKVIGGVIAESLLVGYFLGEAE